VAISKREKELARQRAERQAARRAAAAQRRKRRNAIIASVAAIALVATAAVAVALSLPGDGDTLAGEGASPAASPETTPGDGAASPVAGECTYVESGEAAKEVPALPPPSDVETEQPFEAVLTTNRGDIVFELLTADAPCTVNNLRSLAHFLYYDDTPCHRLTSTPSLSVLQCGDPSGTGSGGPGYTFADENLEGATYERGTVAMANSGPSTNGSQFFLVYQDSQLPPNYTPFGRIIEGLEVLDAVAEAGADPEGDGRPNTEVQIETLRTRAV
jgi:peptidyl-prolyl cis-trans isomerase B (cyclophilin B)